MAPFSHYFSKALDEGSNFPKYFTALFSEAWRDELKELAAKVSSSSQAQQDKREVRVLL